jgi:N-acyl-D-aspartate/D-glutamate deacylase
VNTASPTPTAASRTGGPRYSRWSAPAVDIFLNLFTDFVDTRQHALFYDLVPYDTIIRNGRWFDGTGAPSAVRNIGIRDSHIVAISPHDLDGTGCPRVIDATGKWVLQAVQRLTGELADWYRIDAGHLRIGDRADVVVIDPERLDSTLDDYAEDRVEQYGGLSRMVNRNDATVSAVFVGGRAVFLDGKATDLVGEQRTGRFLWAAHAAPALSGQEGELTSVS